MKSPKQIIADLLESDDARPVDAVADDIIERLDRAGYVVVPKLDPQALAAEVIDRERRIGREIAETRKRIRDGARPGKHRFRL